jgi:glucokinase
VTSPKIDKKVQGETSVQEQEPSTRETSGSLGLVGDIGATHARLRLARQQQWASELVVLPTRDFQSGADLLAQAYAELGSPDLAASALAVAGPVSGDGTNVTVINTGLAFDQMTATSVLGTSPRFVNDFYAQAASIPYLQDLQQMGGDATAIGVRAILGPGSGLGMASLVPKRPMPTGSDGWMVLPSEGGHGDLAPGSFLEAELWSVLAQEHGQVSWETALSGPGILHLYQAMSSIWGTSPELQTSEEVVAQGLASDPLCHQTLETFTSLLGGAAGNFALMVGAQGGVYLSGGIVPKLASMLPSSPLRRRFDERGDLSGYAKAIPLYAVLDEHPGMLGARALLAPSDD